VSYCCKVSQLYVLYLSHFFYCTAFTNKGVNCAVIDPGYPTTTRTPTSTRTRRTHPDQQNTLLMSAAADTANSTKTTSHSTNAQQDAQTAQKTALVFGSNGMVGSEVLRALLKPIPQSTQKKKNYVDQTDDSDPYYYWDEIILIGRKFSPREDTEDDTHNNNRKNKKPKVTQIEMESLVDIDNTILNNNDNSNGQEGLLEQLQNVDACFINVGLSHPYKTDLSYWHSTDVEMIRSMAKLCKHLNVKYISLLSSIDAEDDPTPFSNEELPQIDQVVSTKETDTSAESKGMGARKMMSVYHRMKGLAEQAIIETVSTPSSSSSPIHVSLYRPSNLITKTYRYGCLDRTIFALSPLLDLCVPTRYHSIPVQFLGLTMVRDAENVIKKCDNDSFTVNAEAEVNVTRLTYGDYMQIAGDEYKE
jgi:nucleoside-diphosphate-sugar epimerase